MTSVELRESILAPEGIELHFGTASASERIAAFGLDLAVLLVAMLVLSILMGLTVGIGGVMLVMFFLRHGYFIWFEARWNGRTPGKRPFHLRVIRADGGPLTTEILLARNLTREVELFLPLVLLIDPDVLFAEHSGTVRLVASVWVLMLMLFPLMNARRLRIGDLLAGTRVVVSPPVPLLHDLAARPGALQPDAQRPQFTFLPRQLDIYGEHELEVLEEVLRKGRGEGSREAFEAVTKSICRRIGFDERAVAGRHEVFLRAFYRAQRQQLEQRMLLGKRRLKKRKRSGGPGGG